MALQGHDIFTRNGEIQKNLVPSRKYVGVIINVPVADMSLVARSKTLFLLDVRASSFKKIWLEIFYTHVSLSLKTPFFG
jgi:hypothetical protein